MHVRETMGLDCHAVSRHGSPSLTSDEKDAIFGEMSETLVGMGRGSFRLKCYTWFILEATGFDIYEYIRHTDNKLYSEEIEDLLGRLRKCEASAHRKCLVYNDDADAVLADLVKYFELCLEHNLDVLLL